MIGRLRSLLAGCPWNLDRSGGVHYEYADGTFLFSQCRQIAGCANRVSEHLIGEKGQVDFERGYHLRDRRSAAHWKYDGPSVNPYQAEHDALFAAIRSRTPHNEARYGAMSTLTAVMGRMASYTGRVVTWEDALASQRLGPAEYSWGELAAPGIAVPGR